VPLEWQVSTIRYEPYMAHTLFGKIYKKGDIQKWSNLIMEKRYKNEWI